MVSDTIISDLTKGAELASAEIVVEHVGEIAVLTINRPARLNALTPQMIARLGEVLAAITGRDKDTRVVILTGAGRAFSAGGDMAMFAEPGKPKDQRTITNGLRVAYDTVLHAPQVFIAAIRGACVGSGLVLAGCCDFRLCTPDARFLFPEVKIGMVPAIGVARIAHAMPDRMLRYLVLTGDAYAADRAERDGFIHDIVDDAALMESAFALARQVAKNPREAVRVGKRVSSYARSPDTELALEYEWEANRGLRMLGQTEGLAQSFLDRQGNAKPEPAAKRPRRKSAANRA